MPWAANFSRISSAWRYSNAAIAEPAGKILLAPAAVIRRGIPGPEGRVVQHRLVGVDKRITHPQRQGPPGGRLEFFAPFLRDNCGSVLRHFRAHTASFHHTNRPGNGFPG